ncbi:nucleophile aminohydrolase [Neohortaea acidophila]|uniref:Nucleophile aminohydrolase n=1 Tax=Neohortaea acidophila TaxID=245834 RepID=A0A6A6PQG2_9PEZI|nr:nucleophile aminohydrolase [Neohortaea acidophila]KAF2482348.1 nucleophile aminohydrolase [Neohortaea acidophila]
MTSEKPHRVHPRIILHGGAGNVTRQNLSKERYAATRKAMLAILDKTRSKLLAPDATALDVATYAVSLLENNGIFNSGHGACFTTAGTQELEASVMVSRGYRKRGVGVMNLRRVRNPVMLAREMLIRGEESDGAGAGAHCQLQGETCERLADEWGLDLVKPSYFWVRRQWDAHRKGLGLSCDDETYEREKKLADEDAADDPTWDGESYIPQGTVGAVVLDSFGTICAATSTGGLTNKLPGRVGDTPTIGAGFWAEEWPTRFRQTQSPAAEFSLAGWLRDCLPGLSDYIPLPSSSATTASINTTPEFRAVGMSGTGNGDSFLRVNAARTAAAIARYARNAPYNVGVPLQDTISNVAGPGGELQRSAGDRWRKTGEGEGGIIGIDYDEGKGKVVFDFNCGGLYRAWIDDEDQERFAIFRDEI